MRDALPIYKNNERENRPVGYVILEEDIPGVDVRKAALVPILLRQGLHGYYETVGFGLVDRTTVDTSPRNLA